jgi:hypothetical protein
VYFAQTCLPASWPCGQGRRAAGGFFLFDYQQVDNQEELVNTRF